MSHRRAIAGADGWTPLSPGGLVAWYDAGAAGTCFQDAAISFTAACKHYLSVADNASISATTVLDLFCWVYLDSVGANRPFVVKGTSLSAAASLEYGLYYSHTGTNFKFSVSNGSTITTVTDTGAAPSISTWYFLHAGLRADGTLFISRNNAAEITSASCPAIQDSTNALCLGGYGDLATYHNGRLDSIALTKTSASSAEITALYNSGAGRRSVDCTAANGLDTFWTNCVSWWDGSETSGTRYDAKGTNHLSETFDDIISPTVLNGGFETLGGGETLDTEKLTNGDFETAGGGGADVFGTWAETAGSGAIADEGTSVHGGSHAAKLTYVTGHAYIGQSFSVTAGSRYKLTFWTMGDGTYAGRYQVYDNTNSANIIAAVSTGVTGMTYALVTAYFTAPTGCTSAGLYFYSHASAASSAYFDDVSVKKVTSGDIFANWTEYTPGSSSIEANTVTPYAGSYDAKLNVDSSNSSVILYQLGKLTVGKKYAVQVYAKVSLGSTSTIRFGSLTTYGTATLTTSYALYSATFTAAETDLYLVTRDNCASKSVYFDSATLRSAEIVSAAGIAQGACADTNPVAKWTDQSGNSQRLTQTDLTKRLAYRIAQQNGRPALVGVGGDDSLSITSDLIGTGDVTVAFVCKPTGWGGGNAGRLFSNAKLLFYVNSSGYLSASSNGSTIVNSGASSIALSSVYVVVLTRTSAGVLNFYVNGVLSGSADQASGTPAAGTPSYIGNRADGTTGFTGNLNEALIWTGILSAADIASLTAYARNWWNF